MKRITKIAIIGGSGLNKPHIIENAVEKKVETPFGDPSDNLIVGKINGVDCVLLCRHGRHHSIMPSNINYRANIYALKQEGCTHILSTTACGSLQERLKPGDIVLLNQFIDCTKKRIYTFYDGSCASFKGICHIPMSAPFCQKTSQIIHSVATELGLNCHPEGTNVTIEGPRFSTKAESLIYKSWNADVINMTTVPEVILAKEAGLIYASIALVTDYDCWKDNDDSVSKDKVLEILKLNAEKVTKLIMEVVQRIASEDFESVIEYNQIVASSSVM